MPVYRFQIEFEASLIYRVEAPDILAALMTARESWQGQLRTLDGSPLQVTDWALMPIPHTEGQP